MNRNDALRYLENKNDPKTQVWNPSRGRGKHEQFNTRIPLGATEAEFKATVAAIANILEKELGLTRVDSLDEVTGDTYRCFDGLPVSYDQYKPLSAGADNAQMQLFFTPETAEKVRTHVAQELIKLSAPPQATPLTEVKLDRGPVVGGEGPDAGPVGPGSN